MKTENGLEAERLFKLNESTKTARLLMHKNGIVAARGEYLQDVEELIQLAKTH